MTAPGDNPPIGILLVTERNKDSALAKYAIPAGMDQQMFISTYAVQLPHRRTTTAMPGRRIKKM
jgi:hypothetical protein